MQSATVFTLFCPMLQTTLNKSIAQTQLSCYSGAFLSVATCLAAIFFLIPPLSLKINLPIPQKPTALHLLYHQIISILSAHLT